ncbi:MAG: protease complex subunit PrcB family protein [Desulfotomaculaceae bacterium]|nr:protease complex subunit PrcB family protein [Desulfotomaculaceae bacterium]
MIKFNANLAPVAELILIFAVIVGLAGTPQGAWAAGQSQLTVNAGAVATGEQLTELKKRLWEAQDYQEIRNIIDTFNSMPGTDADAAQVLLDYLRDNFRMDAGNIEGALVKLLTEEQVSQLAKEVGTYNGANAYRYLVSVLAVRINSPDDLTSAMLSLQEGYFSGKYQQFIVQTWPRIFNNTTEAGQWLDEFYPKLANQVDRESLVYAVGVAAQKQLSEAGRLAAIGWLWRVQEKEPDPVYRCNQLLTLYKLGETKALAMIDNLYSGLTSPQARAGLINRIVGIARSQLKEADTDDLIDWLWKAAETDASPYCRQECLAALYTDLGEEKALEQFVRDTDQNGAATLANEEQVFQLGGAGWQLLRDVAQKYPQSYLGRGIKMYEEVRGEPYFEIDRAEEQFNYVWVPPYGDEQYEPDLEIPGWEKFLTELSRHPAADDAAYRLARCYEIKGRFADAVKTMQKARFSTDGDMRYASDGRLVYILDVRMTYDQLKALSLENLEPPLNAFVNYSLAVKEIRRDNYGQAALRLEEFLKQEEDMTASRHILPFYQLNNDEQYDFCGSVEKQLDVVKEIAGLQLQWEKSKDPEDLYNLAAAIFHKEMLYYNHLWAGQRQYYNWLGNINATSHGHAPAEMAAFIRELSNYNHSLPYFQEVYQAPSSASELKARALYSAGLCYIGLDEWGEDASFAFNLSEIQEKVISAYQRFVKEYPNSSMADDALLALGAYTGDAAYLQRILDEYPESDIMGKAKNLMKDMESPYYRPVNQYGWSVPFKIASLDDDSVPQEIKAWAAANILQPFTGSKTLGEWSYLLITAGEKPTAGYSVGIISISGSSDKLKVYYWVDGPEPGQVAAQANTYPYVLIRILANRATVEFVEGNPWSNQ